MVDSVGASPSGAGMARTLAVIWHNYELLAMPELQLAEAAFTGAGRVGSDHPPMILIASCSLTAVTPVPLSLNVIVPVFCM